MADQRRSGGLSQALEADTDSQSNRLSEAALQNRDNAAQAPIDIDIRSNNKENEPSGGVGIPFTHARAPSSGLVPDDATYGYTAAVVVDGSSLNERSQQDHSSSWKADAPLSSSPMFNRISDATLEAAEIALP